MLHWTEKEKAEHRASLPVNQYPKRALPHHWQYYDMADTLLEMGIYVLNPRNIHATSLKEADADWITGFARYRRGLQFHRDLRKRPNETK